MNKSPITDKIRQIKAEFAAREVKRDTGEVIKKIAPNSIPPAGTNSFELKNQTPFDGHVEHKQENGEI